jgi:hypothetical protein
MAGYKTGPQIRSAAGAVSDNQRDGLAFVEIGDRIGCGGRRSPESQAAGRGDKREGSKHGRALLAEFPAKDAGK